MKYLVPKALPVFFLISFNTSCGPMEDQDDDFDYYGISNSVENATRISCSTSAVRGLAQQLVDELQCIKPGLLERIDTIPNVSFVGPVFPYLQRPAAKALASAARRRHIRLTSALRTLPQQYLLYKWSNWKSCAASLAASPGGSNHESGLAIDVSNWSNSVYTLAGYGYRWFGFGDSVHFDYVGGGTVDLRYYSTLAFQRLWNRNHPERRLVEDGGVGWRTLERLRQSPAGGFPRGASCISPKKAEEPNLNPIEVYWNREEDGHYELRALADEHVKFVEYHVDGYFLKPPGRLSREGGNNFPGRYTFFLEKDARKLVVKGFDKSGKWVAKGVGLLDVRPDTGVYIKQMGDKLYEIGLERAPEGVAFIEVRADDYLLTDGVTTTVHPSAPRLAVRTVFNQLGTRHFSITTFNADGSKRGTLYRTFTLR